MKRPRFSFRPNPQIEEHRKAWEILQAVPEGQKSAFLVRSILQNARQENLENTLRRVLRDELRAIPSQPARLEKSIPKEMLGFLDSLLSDEST